METKVEKKKVVVDWGIPALRPDQLSEIIPSCTHGGGALVNSPEQTLFLWRSVATEQARGGTLGFYLDDWRLESLWHRPATYARHFRQCGVKALIEADFSLWSDMSVEQQIESIRRTRIVSRVFQSFDLDIIPNLSWATEESFPFCFQGIPQHAPVCAVECRTPGSHDADRRRFLAGLAEGVSQTQPKSVLVYGGTSHKFWLQDKLPPGPTYHLIDSWTDARGKVRKEQERQERERNQLNLFGGGTQWADAAQVV